MKVVVLGNGLLGKELSKLTKWDNVNRKTHDFDFEEVTSCYRYIRDYDVIVNCVAHTDTYSKEKETHWNINYKAVCRLTDWCNENNKKLVHISTDYIYANSSDVPSEDNVPVHAENWYSYTKLLGDGYVELRGDDSLIIRCGHKSAPFPYEEAYTDMLGNFDYVNIIAKGIIQLIKQKETGVFNVGTDSKTMYELALITNHDVKEGKAKEEFPKDVRMNCDKYKRAIGYNLDGGFEHLADHDLVGGLSYDPDKSFVEWLKKLDNFKL